MKRVLFVLFAALLLLSPAQAMAGTILSFWGPSQVVDGQVIRVDVQGFAVTGVAGVFAGTGAFVEITDPGTVEGRVTVGAGPYINSISHAPFIFPGDPFNPCYTTTMFAEPNCDGPLPDQTTSWMYGFLYDLLPGLPAPAFDMVGQDVKDQAFETFFGYGAPVDGAPYALQVIHNPQGLTYIYNAPDLEPGTPIVPEPASMLLLGTGLVGLVGAVRRRARR